MSEPTALDQYLIELINRARMDPADEAARLGIELNQGLVTGTDHDGAEAAAGLRYLTGQFGAGACRSGCSTRMSFPIPERAAAILVTG